ncbi:MAG TPA: hypothetical protein VNM14_24205 [Planctomycetota bacterium]|jgi:hypothetical protein|nr:hypothetical protein [Planctomycetota bacterium]
MAAALFLLALAAASPQAVDDAKVDQAIKKGVEFLRTAKSPDFHTGYRNSDVLILWTFIHAGVPQDDPKFKSLLDACMSEPLDKTYKVSLLAMCLEEIDRVKYQEKIAQCGQFLVDNQCKNGQWNYGSPTEYAKEVKVPNAPKPVASAEGKGGPGVTLAKDGKPKILQHVAVKKMKEGPDNGDNSNSQYAALGLRACYDAGVTLPEGVILLAVKWWRDSQFKDPKKDEKKAVASAPGISGKVEGWNYKDENTQPDKPPYHAMTAGGVGALVIYDYMLDRKWKDDSYVKAGVNWLTVHYQIQAWNTYYLYGLERAAILFGTEKIGDHFWYAEGANALIAAQHEDGSWGKDTEWFNTTWDTCFSVLFLRRATRALVASEDKGKLKK